MRLIWKGRFAPKLLICGLLGLAAAAFGEEPGAGTSDPQAWPDSPYRHFGARLYGHATLSAYGAADRSFVTAAEAEYVCGGFGGDEGRELAREAAAAPSVNLAQRAAALGRLYVEEFVRTAGGPASLKSVWEKAAEAREEIAPALSKAFTELTGEKEERLLLRFAARLYTTVEPEAAPSRITLADLEDGRLDTSSPAA